MTTAQQITEGLTLAIRAAIEEARLSQRALADETGIPLVTLSRRLRGQSAFTVPEVAAIAKACSVSIVDLALRAERISYAEKISA